MAKRIVLYLSDPRGSPTIDELVQEIARGVRAREPEGSSEPTFHTLLGSTPREMVMHI